MKRNFCFCLFIKVPDAYNVVELAAIYQTSWLLAGDLYYDMININQGSF
jgi:hypothetical protein